MFVVAGQTDEELRRQLAEAIARCCGWGNNRVEFGNEGSVEPLVGYLASTDAVVHRSTARALHQLSHDPDNCIAMHNTGVVKVTRPYSVLYIHLYSPHSGSNHTHIYKINLTVNSK